MTYEFKIGTSLGGVVLLHSLSTPVNWPRDEFIRFPVVKELGSGGAKGMGMPVVHWNWDLLQGAEYTQLLAYKSAMTTLSVYIRTRDDANTFQTFLCDMIWPANIQWSAGRVLKFEITFKNLVQQ